MIAPGMFAQRQDRLELEELTPQSERWHEIQGKLIQSYWQPNMPVSWDILQIELIHNTRLEHEYRSKKMEMEMSAQIIYPEWFAFRYTVKRDLVHIIVRDGLDCNTSPAQSLLGDAKKGVHIVRYPDIQLKSAEKTQKAPVMWLVMFRVCPGHVRQVRAQPNNTQPPSPNFDCHISDEEPNIAHKTHEQFLRSLMYLYEFSPHGQMTTVISRPRHCLPYAVIRLHRRQEETPLQYIPSIPIPQPASFALNNYNLNYMRLRGVPPPPYPAIRPSTSSLPPPANQAPLVIAPINIEPMDYVPTSPQDAVRNRYQSAGGSFMQSRPPATSAIGGLRLMTQVQAYDTGNQSRSSPDIDPGGHNSMQVQRRKKKVITEVIDLTDDSPEMPEPPPVTSKPATPEDKKLPPYIENKSLSSTSEPVKDLMKKEEKPADTENRVTTVPVKADTTCPPLSGITSTNSTPIPLTSPSLNPLLNNLHCDSPTNTVSHTASKPGSLSSAFSAMSTSDVVQIDSPRHQSPVVQPAATNSADIPVTHERQTPDTLGAAAVTNSDAHESHVASSNSPAAIISRASPLLQVSSNVAPAVSRASPQPHVPSQHRLPAIHVLPAQLPQVAASSAAVRTAGQSASGSVQATSGLPRSITLSSDETIRTEVSDEPAARSAISAGLMVSSGETREQTVAAGTASGGGSPANVHDDAGRRSRSGSQTLARPGETAEDTSQRAAVQTTSSTPTHDLPPVTALSGVVIVTNESPAMLASDIVTTQTSTVDCVSTPLSSPPRVSLPDTATATTAPDPLQAWPETRTYNDLLSKIAEAKERLKLQKLKKASLRQATSSDGSSSAGPAAPSQQLAQGNAASVIKARTLLPKPVSLPAPDTTGEVQTISPSLPSVTAPSPIPRPVLPSVTAPSLVPGPVLPTMTAPSLVPGPVLPTVTAPSPVPRPVLPTLNLNSQAQTVNSHLRVASPVTIPVTPSVITSTNLLHSPLVLPLSTTSVQPLSLTNLNINRLPGPGVLQQPTPMPLQPTTPNNTLGQPPTPTIHAGPSQQFLRVPLIMVTSASVPSPATTVMNAASGISQQYIILPLSKINTPTSSTVPTQQQSVLTGLQPVVTTAPPQATPPTPQPPLVSVPQQPLVTVPQQPLVSVPQPPLVSVPPQPLVSVPQQPLVSAPPQPLVSVPQQPLVSAPQQPLVSAPQPPLVSAPQPPLVSVPPQPLVSVPQPPLVSVPPQPLVSVPQPPLVSVLQQSVKNKWKNVSEPGGRGRGRGRGRRGGGRGRGSFYREISPAPSLADMQTSVEADPEMPSFQITNVMSLQTAADDSVSGASEPVAPVSPSSVTFTEAALPPMAATTSSHQEMVDMTSTDSMPSLADLGLAEKSAASPVSTPVTHDKILITEATNVSSQIESDSLDGAAKPNVGEVEQKDEAAIATKHPDVGLQSQISLDNALDMLGISNDDGEEGAMTTVAGVNGSDSALVSADSATCVKGSDDVSTAAMDTDDVDTLPTIKPPQLRRRSPRRPSRQPSLDARTQGVVQNTCSAAVAESAPTPDTASLSHSAPLDKNASVLDRTQSTSVPPAAEDSAAKCQRDLPSLPDVAVKVEAEEQPKEEKSAEQRRRTSSSAELGPANDFVLVIKTEPKDDYSDGNVPVRENLGVPGVVNGAVISQTLSDKDGVKTDMAAPERSARPSHLTFIKPVAEHEEEDVDIMGHEGSDDIDDFTDAQSSMSEKAETNSVGTPAASVTQETPPLPDQPPPDQPLPLDAEIKSEPLDAFDCVTSESGSSQSPRAKAPTKKRKPTSPFMVTKKKRRNQAKPKPAQPAVKVPAPPVPLQPLVPPGRKKKLQGGRIVPVDLDLVRAQAEERASREAAMARMDIVPTSSEATTGEPKLEQEGITAGEPKQEPDELTAGEPKQEPDELAAGEPKQKPDELTAGEPKQEPDELTAGEPKQEQENIDPAVGEQKPAELSIQQDDKPDQSIEETDQKPDKSSLEHSDRPAEVATDHDQSGSICGDQTMIKQEITEEIKDPFVQGNVETQDADSLQLKVEFDLPKPSPKRKNQKKAAAQTKASSKTDEVQQTTHCPSATKCKKCCKLLKSDPRYQPAVILEDMLQTGRILDVPDGGKMAEMGYAANQITKAPARGKRQRKTRREVQKKTYPAAKVKDIATPLALPDNLFVQKETIGELLDDLWPEASPAQPADSEVQAATAAAGETLGIDETLLHDCDPAEREILRQVLLESLRETTPGATFNIDEPNSRSGRLLRRRLNRNTTKGPTKSATVNKRPVRKRSRILSTSSEEGSRVSAPSPSKELEPEEPQEIANKVESPLPSPPPTPEPSESDSQAEELPVPKRMPSRPVSKAGKMGKQTLSILQKLKNKFHRPKAAPAKSQDKQTAKPGSNYAKWRESVCAQLANDTSVEESRGEKEPVKETVEATGSEALSPPPEVRHSKKYEAYKAALKASISRRTQGQNKLGSSTEKEKASASQTSPPKLMASALPLTLTSFGSINLAHRRSPPPRLELGSDAPSLITSRHPPAPLRSRRESDSDSSVGQASHPKPREAGSVRGTNKLANLVEEMKKHESKTESKTADRRESSAAEKPPAEIPDDVDIPDVMLPYVELPEINKEYLPSVIETTPKYKPLRNSDIRSILRSIDHIKAKTPVKKMQLVDEEVLEAMHARVTSDESDSDTEVESLANNEDFGNDTIDDDDDDDDWPAAVLIRRSSQIIIDDEDEEEEKPDEDEGKKLTDLWDEKGKIMNELAELSSDSESEANSVKKDGQQSSSKSSEVEKSTVVAQPKEKATPAPLVNQDPRVNTQKRRDTADIQYSIPIIQRNKRGIVRKTYPVPIRKPSISLQEYKNRTTSGTDATGAASGSEAAPKPFGISNCAMLSGKDSHTKKANPSKLLTDSTLVKDMISNTSQAQTPSSSKEPLFNGYAATTSDSDTSTPSVSSPADLFKSFQQPVLESKKETPLQPPDPSKWLEDLQNLNRQYNPKSELKKDSAVSKEETKLAQATPLRGEVLSSSKATVQNAASGMKPPASKSVQKPPTPRVSGASVLMLKDSKREKKVEMGPLNSAGQLTPPGGSPRGGAVPIIPVGATRPMSPRWFESKPKDDQTKLEFLELALEDIKIRIKQTRKAKAELKSAALPAKDPLAYRQLERRNSRLTLDQEMVEQEINKERGTLYCDANQKLPKDVLLPEEYDHDISWEGASLIALSPLTESIHIQLLSYRMDIEGSQQQRDAAWSDKEMERGNRLEQQLQWLHGKRKKTLQTVCDVPDREAKVKTLQAKRQWYKRLFSDLQEDYGATPSVVFMLHYMERRLKELFINIAVLNRITEKQREKELSQADAKGKSETAEFYTPPKVVRLPVPPTSTTSANKTVGISPLPITNTGSADAGDRVVASTSTATATSTTVTSSAATSTPTSATTTAMPSCLPNVNFNVDVMKSILKAVENLSQLRAETAGFSTTESEDSSTTSQSVTTSSVSTTATTTTASLPTALPSVSAAPTTTSASRDAIPTQAVEVTSSDTRENSNNQNQPQERPADAKATCSDDKNDDKTVKRPLSPMSVVEMNLKMIRQQVEQKALSGDGLKTTEKKTGKGSQDSVKTLASGQPADTHAPSQQDNTTRLGKRKSEDYGLFGKQKKRIKPNEPTGKSPEGDKASPKKPDGREKQSASSQGQDRTSDSKRASTSPSAQSQLPTHIDLTLTPPRRQSHSPHSTISDSSPSPSKRRKHSRSRSPGTQRGSSPTRRRRSRSPRYSRKHYSHSRSSRERASDDGKYSTSHRRVNIYKSENGSGENVVIRIPDGNSDVEEESLSSGLSEVELETLFGPDKSRHYDPSHRKHREHREHHHHHSRDRDYRHRHHHRERRSSRERDRRYRRRSSSRDRDPYYRDIKRERSSSHERDSRYRDDRDPRYRDHKLSHGSSSRYSQQPAEESHHGNEMSRPGGEPPASQMGKPRSKEQQKPEWKQQYGRPPWESDGESQSPIKTHPKRNSDEHALRDKPLGTSDGTAGHSKEEMASDPALSTSQDFQRDSLVALGHRRISKSSSYF